MSSDTIGIDNNLISADIKITPKVLIVDDNSILRTSLQERLRAEGFIVDAAENPHEAEVLLKDSHYQAVIMDVNFGNSTESGDDFILKNEDLLSQSKPIIFTGYGIEKIKRPEALEARGVVIIEKGAPDSFNKIKDEIYHTVKQTLDNLLFKPQTVSASTSEISRTDISGGDIAYPAGLTLLHTFDGHTDWITQIAWSPDGKILASPSNDQSVRLWDADSGNPVHVFKEQTFQVACVTWSPDGRLLAAASKGIIYVYDVKERTLLPTLNAPHSDRLVACVAWSPDGKYLASTSRGGTIQIWDTSIWTIDKTLKGEADWCLSVAWSPDGRRLASADDKKLRIWDVEAEQSVVLERHDNQITCVIWLNDSDTIITGSADKTVSVWDAKTNQQRRVLTGHTARVTSVSASCDESLLASKSVDGTVKLWRGDTWEMVSDIPEPAEAPGGLYQVGIAFNPKRAVLATLGNENKSVRVWRLNLGSLLKPDIESILPASVNDQPTSVDSVGFKPYVRAVADFLINDKTRPPLTVSIEGEWGCGKSSFMLQLEEELRKRTPVRKVAALLGFRKKKSIPNPPFRPIPLWGKKSYRLLRRYKLLRDFLSVPGAARKKVRQIACPTIRFNAWRHDKDASLWASFALELVRKLSEELPLHTRLLAKIKLLLRRFRWKDGWIVVLRALAVTFMFVALSMALISFLYSGGIDRLIKPSADVSTTAATSSASAGDKSEKNKSDKLDPNYVFLLLVKGSGLVGYLAVFMYLMTKFKGLVGDPLSFDLRRYVKSPDYDSHVALIENFHEDFKKIVETYAGQNKVYVFIDDLDRCDVPKAADLMQAINLLTSDSPQIVFVIGMDREKIAAGLAVKYEKIVPLLSPMPPSATAVNGSAPAPGSSVTHNATPAYGLEFGYNFIEKFIQIPFRVPQTAKLAFENLLDHISPVPVQAKQPRAENSKSVQTVNSDRPNTINNARPVTVESPSTTSSNGGSDGQPEDTKAAIQEEYREKIKLLVANDSLTVRNIVLMVAPALDYNPRRLKQFINMFRLKALIAAETGLFGVPTLSSDRRSMTLQQLGKFVAISLRWPRLLADLEEERTLLNTLKGWAVGRPIESAESKAHRWTEFADLKALLSFGCDGKEQNDPFDPNRQAEPRKYSLDNIEVDKLLQVSPQIRGSQNILSS